MEGKNFFSDLDPVEIVLGAAAGAAFGSGLGGFWGAVEIGAVSNAGVSAWEEKVVAT